MKTIIYTDGASSGNPGKSGWGAIILRDKSVQEIGGFVKSSTNNRMEITAAIEALKKTEPEDRIIIYTDSEYLVNGITRWIYGWFKNNWKNVAGKEILNKDLWQELYDLAGDREITWKVVRGHSATAGNNRADEIAVEFSIRQKADLYFGELKNYSRDLTEPTEEQAQAGNEKDRKKTKAYSYLSLVDGILQRHSSWTDCEIRVKGKQNAKFRKSISPEDEENIIREWKIKKA